MRLKADSWIGHVSCECVLALRIVLVVVVVSGRSRDNNGIFKTISGIMLAVIAANVRVLDKIGELV